MNHNLIFVIVKPTKKVGIYFMWISTKSQYGLRTMVHLAKNKNKICSLREIAKKEKISFDYLEKIILRLKKADLVKAKKGARGGYFLLKNPAKIKIGEIIKSLEGEIVLVKCIKHFCPREKSCLSKFFWKNLQNILERTLNSFTLADLTKNYRFYEKNSLKG